MKQAATNARAVRWLTELLDGLNVNDPDAQAERIVRELIRQGIGPVPAPVPAARRGSVMARTSAAQQAAMAKIRADLAAARLRVAAEQAEAGQ